MESERNLAVPSRQVPGLYCKLVEPARNFVDLIQSHDNEYGDPDQVVSETIPALRRIQEF